MNTAPFARWSNAEVGALVRVNAELTELNRQLGATQDPLVQSEKTASIGQLAGSAPKSLQRIFDPSFTIRPVDKGMERGQSLAHGLVKKHGGQIDVTSEPGPGAGFRITLPIERKQAAT